MKLASKLFLLTVCFFIHTELSAQTKWLKVYGIQNTLPKYITTQYAQDYINLPEFGPVALYKKSISNWNFFDDLDFFIMLKKKHINLKFALGFFTERYQLNSDYIYLQAASYNAFIKRSGIRFSPSIGYKILGKRALQLSISSGASVNIISFKDEYNPINWGISLFGSSSSTRYGKPLNYFPNNDFALPPIALTASLDLELYNNIFSLATEYRDKNFSFNSDKNPLFDYSYSVKLQWAIILGNKYIN
ncbi:MAG: hypothetical protein NTZ59_12535 [Bacteroidetes bacterium]|jgi:hypothetical protein|nr:hypothetical protein [Bacteroidota bacterium]